MNDRIPPPAGPATSYRAKREDSIARGRLRAEEMAAAGQSPVEILNFLLGLLRTHGDDAGLLSDAAALFHACGRPDDAAVALYRALEADAGHPDALANLSMLLEDSRPDGSARELVRLNVGAGDDRRDGYLSVDLRSDIADVVATAERLPFRDGCAAEVLAFDILEHVPSFRTQDLLREWHRVLTPGGKLTIRVPNLQVLGDLLARGENLEEVIRNVYGGHRWGPDGAYDTHHHGFTPSTFVEELARAGFITVKLDNEPNMTGVAVRSIAPA